MQSSNLYAYCINNPLVYTDPSGEYIWAALPPAVFYMVQDIWMKYGPSAIQWVSKMKGGSVDAVKQMLYNIFGDD